MMKKSIASIVLTTLLMSPMAHAKTTATQAWARATAQGQSIGGAFVTLTSDQNAQLIAAQSPAAQEVQMHNMTHDKGMMKMAQQPSINLPANQTVELKPGGLHLMLIGLKKPLATGSIVPIQLTIKIAQGKTEIIKLKAQVRAITDNMSSEHMH